MTTITGKVQDATGAAVAGLAVRAELVAASTELLAGGEVVRNAEATSAADGTWSLSLLPVSALAQSTGAYYRVRAGGQVYTITVPDAGSHNVASVLVVPGPLPATGATVAALADKLQAIRNTAVIAPPGNHWYLGSDPFDAALLAIIADGDLFTYASGAQVGETYRRGGGTYTLIGTIATPPAGVEAALWMPAGAVTVHDLTVLPDTDISTSASVFLNNNAGQVWEFFADAGASFGVYDHSTNRQVVRVDAGALQDSIHVDNAGRTTVQTFDVNGDAVRVHTARTPASASAAGNQGEIVWDSGFVYVCVATNTWKRAALASW